MARVSTYLNFARNAEDLHAVIQEAANWMESQQASLQENNDFKNQSLKQRKSQTSSTALRKRFSRRLSPSFVDHRRISVPSNSVNSI